MLIYKMLFSPEKISWRPGLAVFPTDCPPRARRTGLSAAGMMLRVEIRDLTTSSYISSTGSPHQQLIAHST